MCVGETEKGAAREKREWAGTEGETNLENNTVKLIYKMRKLAIF